MTEPKLISPLLDNFLMGDPISDHCGIRCCPAMEKDSSSKYIVKIISLPSSENQLNALLLTGALKDNEDAQKYFKNRADDIVAEINLLQQLSKHEGFLPYDGYQIVPAEDGVGYDIYILSHYKRSLERQFTKKPVTHLEAINLGLDMCAALTACRRNGYIFINLKPSNIYVTPHGEYKLSDLGFVNLKSLKYSTIPDHYIGSYTPPELKDAFSTPNETIDVYALGMILYRIFNGNVLPEMTENEFSAPAYADAEMAEIILKALKNDPAERWQDPAQMGQMLVNYMQKNGATNDPIVPPAEPEPLPEEAEEAEEIAPEIPDETAETQNVPTDEEQIEEPQAADAEEASASNDDEDSACPQDSEDVIEDEPDITTDEITEDPQEENISYEELSDEVSQMLSQADELANMEVPEPVVAPEAIEIVLPEPEPQEEDDDTIAEEDADDTPPEADDDEFEDENCEEITEDTPPRSHWLRNVILSVLGLCLIAGGFLFYKFYFMQTIENLEIIGNKNSLSVVLETDTDESLLSIACTDLYGKTIIVPVVNGKAEFSGLIANAEYTIDVQIKGFHGLTGKTTAKYFTPTETAIVQYSVVTGTLPGTAILSFTVSGPDSENWRFKYSSSATDSKEVTFTGHTVTLTDLEENKVYTGVLEPEADLFIAQSTTINFTATDIIQATNLMITSCTDGKLTAKWSVPESIEVESWNVRCYNGTDYDKTVTTADTSVEFTDLDHTDSFTIEVTAAGQSLMQTASIGENSVTVQNLTADTSNTAFITLQWDASDIPEGGWIISYTVSGSETVISTTSSENRVVIKPAIPESKYVFTVRAADSTPTVCEPCVCQTPDSVDFMVNYSGNIVTKDNLRFYLCKRPMTNTWSHNDLNDNAYRSTFRIGENAGYVIFLNRTYDISYETITTAFVIEDENGQIVSVSSTDRTWTDMWYKNYCELDIPSLPNIAGNYTISIYFNGQFAVKQAFTMTEA